MTSPKQSDVRLYLDQMLRVEVADALRQRGHDVVRATDLDMARADDEEILAFLARTTDRTFANRLVIVDARKERWISTDEN